MPLVIWCAIGMRLIPMIGCAALSSIQERLFWDSLLIAPIAMIINMIPSAMMIILRCVLFLNPSV